MNRMVVLSVLVLANGFIWTIPVPRGLAISFLDVGQGRAILVQSPSGGAVLVDGGPDSSVLRGIGSELPFFVRTLDAVIETNPDAANIGGLPEVLRRYRVRTFIEPEVSTATKAAQALHDEIVASPAHAIVARRGMRIILGQGVHVDILFPDNTTIGKDSHSNSIIVRVVYGETSFLLPSDATQKVQAHLLSLGDNIKSDVFLAPHYGSKDALSLEFLKAVAPRYAVLSYACGNRWGYPAPEIAQSLTGVAAQVLSTCENGTVTFFSDGRRVFAD